MTATDELMALLAKATAMNGETFAQTVDRIICEHSAWIGCPNKQIAEKIAFSALVRASAITERADSEEVTALIAERERLREALTRSGQGWANAIELGLIPPQHRNTAQILADEARTALGASHAAK